MTMGYGLGVFLIALGLILALAVNDSLNGVDLTMVGWILALAGLLVIALTAFQANKARRADNLQRLAPVRGGRTQHRRPTAADRECPGEQAPARRATT